MAAYCSYCSDLRCRLSQLNVPDMDMESGASDIKKWGNSVVAAETAAESRCPEVGVTVSPW